jgi:transposase
MASGRQKSFVVSNLLAGIMPGVSTYSAVQIYGATSVGVDLAKHVIQVHAVDASGKIVANRPLSRDKFMVWCAQLPTGCIVAMEVSSIAPPLARKLLALRLDLRIIAAPLVRPYPMQGKGGKNDANDAAAIFEAASRPTMRFVPVKTGKPTGHVMRAPLAGRPTY